MVAFGKKLEEAKQSSSLPEDCFLNYEGIKSAIQDFQRDSSVKEDVWCFWERELHNVKAALEVAKEDVVMCCECDVLGAVLRCHRRKKASAVKTQHLIDAVIQNREGFRKSAKKMDKACGTRDGLQAERMKVFDVLLKDIMDDLEYQHLFASTLQGSQRSYTLLFFLVLLAVLICVLVAMQPNTLDACVIVGSVAMFVTAWANAANDIANSVGTSVGAGALTVLQAIVLGSLFEALGCVLIGPLVAKEISKGIIATEPYAEEGYADLFALMMVCVLIGCGSTTLLATAYGLPISATHGIIGGLVAVALVGQGYVPDAGVQAVNWSKMGMICLGWVGAPAAGGACAFVVYMIIHHFVLAAEDPAGRSRKLQPLFLWLCLFVNVLFMLIKGPEAMRPDSKAAAVGIAIGSSFCATLCVEAGKAVYARKWPAKTEVVQVRPSTPPNQDSESDAESQQSTATGGTPEPVRVKSKLASGSTELGAVNEAPGVFEFRGEAVECRPDAGISTVNAKFDLAMEKLKEQRTQVEQPEWQTDPKVRPVEQPFVSLLIVSALSVAFAHGGNDVGNAVGPYAVILEIRKTGGFAETPSIPFLAILAGTVGFVMGIFTMGPLTISTVGTKITRLTPTRSFATQIGAAFAVLSSSALKLPVSTSHCLVGAVIGIGAAQRLTKTGEVNWTVLKRIFLAWGITIPLAMVAALMVFGPAVTAINWDFI